MAYDNTKLQIAVGGWLEAKCTVGYGQVYAMELLASFENYCRETSALKASPGIIAFSREMNRREFGRKRISGLQYMTGLELIERVPVEERRLSRAIATGKRYEHERAELEAAMKSEVDVALDEIQEADEVAMRMLAETKERIAGAGANDPIPV